MNKTIETISIVDDLKIHVSWLHLAQELFRFGYYNICKEILDEVIFHSLVLKDKLNYIKSLQIISRILFIEADFNDSPPHHALSFSRSIFIPKRMNFFNFGTLFCLF